MRGREGGRCIWSIAWDRRKEALYRCIGSWIMIGCIKITMHESLKEMANG